MTRKKTHLADQLTDAAAEDAISPEALALETALLALHGADEVAPSAALWDRIEARISQGETAPGTETVGPEDGVWEALAPGIERKVVQIDRGAGLQSYFVRMRAGSVFPSHQHGADEHCVILEGRLEIGGHSHGAGTYHLARQGHPHVPITAQTDALFFIRGAL